MPRAIWTGAISFGLVNVPVKLYSAVSRKTVRFNQLHETDGVRIQQRRVCTADGEEVAFENIVKGYELTPGEYVVVSQEELDAIEPVKTKTIEVSDFVDAAEIDPVYYDAAYYVLPDRGAGAPYQLLLTAMRDTGKVAIARVVIRTKEKLVALRPVGDMLVMETMNFADEVVPPDRLEERPDASVKTAPREVAMAHQLVESLSAEFDPSKYQDTYRERVLGLIAQKAAGEEVTLPAVEEPEETPDLMAALEASVKAAQSERGGKKPAKKSRSGAKSPAKRRAPAKKS